MTDEKRRARKSAHDRAYRERLAADPERLLLRRERDRAYRKTRAADQEWRSRLRANDKLYREKHYDDPRYRSRRRDADRRCRERRAESEGGMARKREIDKTNRKLRAARLKRSLPDIMRVMQIDASGVEAILAEAKTGKRYSDIAMDWLVEPNYIGYLMSALGFRRGRACNPKDIAEGRVVTKVRDRPERRKHPLTPPRDGWQAEVRA